jgi:hypothetical protein
MRMNSMNKIFLTGWFIIRMHTLDGVEHNYLFEDPVKNTMVSATLEAPLSYEAGTWIKLDIAADCTTIEERYEERGIAVMLHRNIVLCNAQSVKELKCTERNSFIVNGIAYC